MVKSLKRFDDKADLGPPSRVILSEIAGLDDETQPLHAGRT